MKAVSHLDTVCDISIVSFNEAQTKSWLWCCLALCRTFWRKTFACLFDRCNYWSWLSNDAPDPRLSSTLDGSSQKSYHLGSLRNLHGWLIRGSYFRTRRFMNSEELDVSRWIRAGATAGFYFIIKTGNKRCFINTISYCSLSWGDIIVVTHSQHANMKWSEPVVW